MSHPVSIVREFATRESSVIGAATIATVRLTGDATLALDGKPLSGASIEYLMTFALQSLQDAYAGKTTLADAKAAFDAKYERLIDGTIGVRGPGSAVSEETRIGREIVRDKLRAKGGDAWKAYKDAADADAKAAILDAIIDKNADAIATLVAEERTRRAAAKAKLADTELDL